MELKKIAVGLTALLGMSVANAHNVWLEPASSQDEYVVKLGHEQTETYPDLKCARQINCR